MRQLVLIRHAKSDWANAQLSDFERTLNARGRRDAPAMGRRLARAGVRFDRMLCSPATRAKTTAMILAAEIDYDVTAIDFEPDIYEASADRLIEVVRRIDDRWQHVALIGHNPGLADLACELGDSPIDNLPTLGTVHLELNIDEWIETEARCARTVDFDYPERRR